MNTNGEGCVSPAIAPGAYETACSTSGWQGSSFVGPKWPDCVCDGAMASQAAASRATNPFCSSASARASFASATRLFCSAMNALRVADLALEIEATLLPDNPPEYEGETGVAAAACC